MPAALPVWVAVTVRTIARNLVPFSPPPAMNEPVDKVHDLVIHVKR